MDKKEINRRGGRRLKELRQAMHLTQKAMAKILEETPSQLQLYEQGKISADVSLLVEMASICDMPISYFFEDIRDDKVEISVLYSEEVQKLAYAYYHIRNKLVAQNIYQLLISLAEIG